MAPSRIVKGSTANVLQEQRGVSGKRKADYSPMKNDRVKRSALGNLTNAAPLSEAEENTKKSSTRKNVPAGSIPDARNVLKPISSRTRAKAVLKKVPSLPCDIFQAPNDKKSKSKPSDRIVSTTSQKTKNSTEASKRTSRRISNEFEKTEESLYVSALEEIPSDISRLSSDSNRHASKSDSFSSASDRTLSQSSTSSSIITSSQSSEEEDVFLKSLAARPILPHGVADFDKQNWNDPFQVSHYAQEIFDYLKSREHQYQVKDYMSSQPELSKWMRSLLIDWMVEVQESFELNHETLYLAVKIVDTYLGKERVSKDSLQLLGAASLLIACKYDERTPPLIDDFLFICDGAYKRSQLLKMEMTVFRAIDYDLSFPLSYRFLRRYARCGSISMVALTLARYILELSLMDYSTIQLSDSKLACAALFISLRMNNLEGWNATNEFYSGYKLMEFAPIVVLLNSLLHRKPKETLSTVRNKYSHKIFHQVTTIQLMDINRLFENFPDVAKKLSGSQLTYQSIIATCSSTAEQSEKNMPKIQPARKHKTLPLPLIG